MNLRGLFNAIFQEEQQFNPFLGDQEVHAFLKGISLKVNAIARVEFELASYVVITQPVSHYTRGDSPSQSNENVYSLFN